MSTPEELLAESKAWEKIAEWFDDPDEYPYETGRGLCLSVGLMLSWVGTGIIVYGRMLTRLQAHIKTQIEENKVKVRSRTKPQVYLWPVRILDPRTVVHPDISLEEACRLRAALARSFAQQAKDEGAAVTRVYLTEQQAWRQIAAWFENPGQYWDETGYGLCSAVELLKLRHLIDDYIACSMYNRVCKRTKKDEFGDYSYFLYPTRTLAGSDVLHSDVTLEEAYKLRAALARQMAGGLDKTLKPF